MGNVVKGSTETLTNICNITRIAGKQIGERNVELDLQYNRVLATDAMAQASKLADTGKLAEARKVLTSAQEHIKKSKSNKDEYCVNLVKDMEKIQSNMVDRSAYRSKGAKNDVDELSESDDAAIDQFHGICVPVKV